MRNLEESFLCAEDLDRAGGMLGEVHEAAGVGDEARPHQLTNCINKQVQFTR